MDNPLYLKQIEVGPMENFVYLIGDKNKGECVMVDPAWNVEAVCQIAEADNMKVTAGLLTHAHHDHCNGADELVARTNGRLYANKLELPYLGDLNDAPYMKDLKSEITGVDSGDELKVGDINIQFIHTPGHTPGSQCFLIQGNLVSGDTLFINGCGRCDMLGGSSEKMYESLQRLSKLDGQTILFPGHNYADHPTSTMADQVQHNPYFQFETLDDFIHLRMRPRN